MIESIVHLSEANYIHLLNDHGVNVHHSHGDLVNPAVSAIIAD